MAKPPYKGGPPWGSQDPPQFYSPPPPPNTAQPQTPPYIGASGFFGWPSSLPSSAVVPVQANPGDALLIVLASQASIAGTTITDQFGSPYLTGPTGTQQPTYFLFCPNVLGPYPKLTITPGIAGRQCIVAWVQVVGGNPQFLFDGLQVTNSAGGSTTASFSTYAPNDLIVWFAANTGLLAPAATPSAGYQTQFVSGNIAGGSLALGSGYTLAPQPANTAVPHFTARANVSYMAAIRTLPNQPNVIGPPAPIPILPPWTVNRAPGQRYVYPPPSVTGVPAATADVTYSLTGQTAAFTEGTITSEIDYSLTGQTATLTEGTPTETVSYGLTAQTATFTEGTLTDSITDALTAETGTFTEGTVTDTVSYGLTAESANFSEGSVPSEADYGLTQQTGTFAEGTITPSQGGDQIFALTGQTAVFTEGTITATGGDVTPVTTPSQAGGTGKPRFKPRYSSEIFEEEIARIEAQLIAATKQREAIEAKLEEVEQAVSVPSDARDFVVGIQRAIDRAERRERARQQQPISVPVYFRTPAKSVGVERVETIERLRTLASISRHREEVASERVRKLREKIDEDAASYLMNLLMWEWDDDA